MKPFHELIKAARIAHGFQTAKEFVRSKKDIISMSYETYANLEAGKYLPPAEKLAALLQSLEVQDVKEFLFSYVHTLMPNDLFKSYFLGESKNNMILKNDSYNYKEKFQDLLEFNRLQAKNEISDEQIRYFETDLVSWDIINLFISRGDEGLTLAEISDKTDSGPESTRKRINELIRLKMLKEIESEKFMVAQDVFVIPRRPVANNLTHALVQRELGRCYADKRNSPYTRFRFMQIDVADREVFENFIDNFILDSRRFIKQEGKTHYLQVLFSDRLDLS